MPVSKPVYQFMGSHFYIASNGACKNLIKYMFPIDIQVDYYMAHLKTLGYINLEGYPVINQKIHFSSIQDICVKCFLPKNTLFYVLIIVFIFILIFLVRRYSNKYKACVKTCKV